MTWSTRVTENGHTTIPEELRETYEVTPGDEVVRVDTDDGILLKKRTRTSGPGLLADDTHEEKREEIAEELGERLRDRSDRNYEE